MELNFKQEILLGLVFLGCLIGLFSPALLHSEIPAFRDGYHFYYPQALWQVECAGRGDWLPVWSPNEGLGVSTAGQPSAALYYPMRIFWFTPGFNVSQRYALILILHIAIAAAGLFYAAKGLQVQPFGCWLAGVCYALSCPVIFQASNLIFLCSAAWIGFAIGATVRLLRHGPPVAMRTWLIFSGACSMMLLGGDPHTSVNALIATALVVLGGNLARTLIARLAKLRQVPPGTAPLDTTDPNRVATGQRRRLFECGWYVASVGLIALLTLPQTIPAARWLRHSARMENSTARLASIPVAARATAEPGTTQSGTDLQQILGPDFLSRSHSVYDFSLSPWHLGTLVWPTLGGHYQPRNSRWFDALPAEGRMWVPSLYLGTLPLLLLLAPAAGRDRLRRWLWLMLLIVLSFAFGNYAWVWLLREGLQAVGLESWSHALPRDSAGSPYGLLTQTVPFYSAFRYPAKWTTFVAAVASLLAAYEAQRVLGSKLLLREYLSASRRQRSVLISLSSIGLFCALALAAAVAMGWTRWLDDWFESVAKDRLLGSPTSATVARSLAIAFGVPVVVLFAFRELSRLTTQRATQNLGWLLLVVTMVEMSLVASQWLVFTPVPQLAIPPSGQSSLWARSATPLPLSEAMQSHLAASPRTNRPLSLGKLGTLYKARVLNATQSIEPAEFADIRTWLDRNDNLSGNQPDLDRVLATLGVTHRLIAVSGNPEADAQVALSQNGRPSLEFQWQAVPNAAALCELAGNTASMRGATVDWEWLRSSALRIKVASSAACKLIVRQTNDGGWRIDALDSVGTLEISEEPLFIEIDLPSGVTQFELRRKWLW